MIFNWDATQFVISPDGNCEVMYCKVKKNDDLPMTQKSAGGVKFAIKLYHYHNAAGAIAPPVFVIADETMDAEAFSAHRIAGLSTNNANGHGWVVFAKTRNGNAAFYEWFAREIVIPFVNNSRTHNGLEAVRIRTHFCIRSLPSAVLSVSMTSSSTPTHNTLRSCTLFLCPYYVPAPSSAPSCTVTANVSRFSCSRSPKSWSSCERPEWISAKRPLLARRSASLPMRRLHSKP
jgi:hypothetical protein